ncbi:MAG: cyclic nucleotide-binding domain-containing protein [Pseudomonadota bacterium]
MRKVLYILGSLNDEDVEWMASTGQRRVIDAASGPLIREGEPSTDLFFVLDGHAVVHIEGVGEVARLGTGEVVGEMSFVDSAPPSATVTGDAGCVVLALDKRAMETRLRADLGFSSRFYKAMANFLADRLRSSNIRRSGGASLGSSKIADDELDERLLDNVALAGARFERMLSMMSGARSG